ALTDRNDWRGRSEALGIAFFCGFFPCYPCGVCRPWSYAAADSLPQHMWVLTISHIVSWSTWPRFGGAFFQGPSFHSPDCWLAEARSRIRQSLFTGRLLCGTFPCQNNSDPPPRPGKCGSISGQLTFPRYTLMWFIHALDAIFELTAVVRKPLSHLIEAAWHVAAERGPDGDNLADFELVGGHRFLDLGQRSCNTLDLHSPLGRFGKIRSHRSCSLGQ